MVLFGQFDNPEAEGVTEPLGATVEGFKVKETLPLQPPPPPQSDGQELEVSPQLHAPSPQWLLQLLQ
jgi:hypothetical protein